MEEAGELLGIPGPAMQTAIEEGTITLLKIGTQLAIGWEDVAVLGLEHRWTPRMLTEALRGRNIHALPPLVRTVAGRVALPSYQWKILRLLAARRSKEEERELTVSDLLEEAVSTAVMMQIENWASLEASQPGVRAAEEWPAGETR